MDELLVNLEKKLKGLLDDYHCVKNVNHQLTETQRETLRNHTGLLAKQAAAVATIERLIAKLKALEEVK